MKKLLYNESKKIKDENYAKRRSGEAKNVPSGYRGKI